MIAVDPILIEFYQGNVITLSLLLSLIAAVLKLLAVMSKGSNKTLDFLINLVEVAKNGLANRKALKQANGKALKREDGTE